MCIINIFRSAYSDEHESLEVESGNTIAGSIDADLDNAVISVNGYEKDKDYVLSDGDLCTIRVFPAANDDAQNAADIWVAIGLGILVGVIGALTGGAAIGITAGMMTAILWTGGSNITRGITGKTWTAHIMPDWPEIPESPDQTKTLPHVRGAENQSLMGKPIPFVMGRHLITPYYCGKMYTEIGGDDGDEQYVRVLLMLGYSKLKVTDIKLGELLIASNSEGVMDNDTGQRIACDQGLPGLEAEIELCQSDRECSLYPQAVYEEPLQIELTNVEGVRLESKRFSARNPHKVQVEITLPCLVGYNDSGNEVPADVSVGVMWRWHTLDGSDTWKTFPRFEGCDSYSDGVSKFIRTKNKQMRFVASKSFGYGDLPRITRVDPVTQQAVRELSPSTMIDLMVFRASENSTDSKVRHQVYLTAVRTWMYDYRKTKEQRVIVVERPVDEERRRMTSRLAVRIKATTAVGDQLRAINCVLESYARVWDRHNRQWSSTEATTRNPAAVALKALTSPMLGKYALADDQIDLEAFGAWHEFCDDIHTRDIAEMNDINKRNCVLECNGIVYQQMKMSDLLDLILHTGRACYVRSGRKISVIMDKARSQIVAIFNNQNVISASNSKQFYEMPDGVKASFIDEDCGWMTNTLYVNFDDGSTMIKKDYEYQAMELRYVTHRNQVWHTCMNEQAKSRMRPEIWTRTVTTEGHLVGLMDLVQIQDDTIVVGIGDGAEVKSLEYDGTGKYITAIHTNGRFNVADTDREYGLKVMQADGINEPAVRVCRVVIKEAGYHSSFSLASPIFTGERIVPQEGDLIAFGEYGKETIDAVVVGKKSGEDGKFELSLVPYSHEPYEYEKTTVMPEFDSKVNPPQPFAGIQELPHDYVSRTEMYKSMQALSSGTEDSFPEAPVMGGAYASEDCIRVSWQQAGEGLANTVRHYVVEMMRIGVFEVVGETSDLSYEYRFVRPDDGYPEADELEMWRVRVKSVNVYGKESPWSDEASVDTSGYLTWKAPVVDVTSIMAEEEGIVIRWTANPDLTYGSIRYGYTIRYDGLSIASKQGVLSLSDTYTFDRDMDKDGYPEKTGVIASLQAMGIDPKGRDLSKYSVEVQAYTIQKPEHKTTDTSILMDRYYGTWVPAAVQQVKAVAYQDRIEVEAAAPSTPSFYGTPYRYIFERKKGNEDWERFEIDGPSITMPFDRQVDGYPEAEELATWRFRAKAVSTAGIENVTWGGGTDGVPLNLDQYGTWKVQTPNVNASNSDRTIRLVMSQPTRADNRSPYGTIQYKVQVRRPVTDNVDTWFKPTLSLDPYQSDANYKDGEGFYISSAVYLQTMPLIGQDTDQVENTVYMFRVAAVNEASESGWVEIVATAEASSIKDIVKAKETVKEAYISDLSALSANLGTISQGSLSGNDNNKWDLSTFVDDLGHRHYEGEFRVGGDEQFIHVQPILDSYNMPTGDYSINFNVGSFELSSTANRINGELIVTTGIDSLDRTRITPTGTYFEHRETSSSGDWHVISQLRTDGLSTESVYSPQSLVITNHNLQTRRKRKIDIGRPYLSEASRVWHFDTDLLDQYQAEGLEVLGNVALVDQYNATGTSLDFTPAILAVAPYAEIGRSAYGQYNAQMGIGSPDVFTVEFWIQYIWAENQVLFDVGNRTDKVRLVVQNDEVYFNDYDPDVDAVPFNQEILQGGDVHVFNEPAAASSTIQHYGQGAAAPPAGHVFTLDDLGIVFEKNTWLHVGIVLASDTMEVYIDLQKVVFQRYSKGSSTAEVILNATQNTFVLDELLIDTTTTEAFEDFAYNTIQRIPWAALDRKNKQLILEADNFITNIFDPGSPFESRVKQIISQMKENGEI